MILIPYPYSELHALFRILYRNMNRNGFNLGGSYLEKAFILVVLTAMTFVVSHNLTKG